MILCGISEVNITPPLGSDIPGYFENRLSTGVKDDLFAKSFVIESKGEINIFIVVDCIDIERVQIVAIRDRVNEFTGVSQNNIMISSTHTHTGAPVTHSLDSSPNTLYLEYFVQKVSDAAIIALDNRQEAVIGFGSGTESDIAFNRRYFMKEGHLETNPGILNPNIRETAGPIDPEVSVVRIDDINGNPIGVLSNYACHTDVVGGTEYSADFPGEVSKTIKNVLGENVVSIFFMGASGNINHIDVSGELATSDKEHYKRMGKVLGGEIIKVREKIKYDKNVHIDIKQSIFQLPLRQPTVKEVQEAKEIIASEKEDVVEQAFARQVMMILESYDEYKDIEIQVAKIGSLAIVGLPAEIFVEFGLEIKEKSPFNHHIINELCNGSIRGYVCTREAYVEGGYEPRIKNYSRPAEEAGELFVKHALKLLKEIK